MSPHISVAIWVLSNGASFKVNGDTYADLEWLGEGAPPSEEAVMAKWAELQAEYEVEQQAAEAAKQAAQTKLATLGLTPEDLKLLLG
jgi:3-oxoacyl-[acyl-carrier-protein] synthase III